MLEVLPKLRGAFSIVCMDEGHVVGVRDPNGFRPLCLGRLESGWVLASETPALDLVGASFVREIEPGEMIVIDATGYRSVRAFPEAEVRSEERRVGKGCVRTCRCRWSPYHKKKKEHKH